MLAIERRGEIMAALAQEKSVLVADLANKYGVTEETIRRDLERLEKEGVAKRTYGGAVIVENTGIDASFRIRAKTNVEQKMIIAGKVLDLVENGENIILDASSTCVLIAKKLKKKDRLTIITNSVEILLEFADCKNISVISTGGVLRESSLSLVGRDAERLLGNFTADKAIISCKGIDFDKGVTESNIAETEIKRAMVGSAKQVILALDSSKFSKLSFTRLMDLRRAHIVVTDDAPGPEWKEWFEINNIKLL